jgi:hypothetical protein
MQKGLGSNDLAVCMLADFAHRALGIFSGRPTFLPAYRAFACDTKGYGVLSTLPGLALFSRAVACATKERLAVPPPIGWTKPAEWSTIGGSFGVAAAFGSGEAKFWLYQEEKGSGQ